MDCSLLFGILTISVFLVVLVPQQIDAVQLDLFYPFGQQLGDTVLPLGDDISSEEVYLDEKVYLYNVSYNSLYVNLNGHITFNTEFPDYRGDQQLPFGYPMIAVFLADVDTRSMGRVYFRSESDSDILARAANDVQIHFLGFDDYSPTSLFIVTWDRVGYYNEQYDKANTFQLVLVTDGANTFTFFHYLDDGIEWRTSEGKFPSLFADSPPQAGFDGGEGSSFYTLPASGQEAATFITGSNVNVNGVWMYHIGNTGSNGTIKPAEINTGQVTLFEVETEQGDRCFENSIICHRHAQCIDNNRGTCCACVPPFYGNGLSCLDAGQPQKLNGNVTGILNGVALGTLDLHTYVITTDGRSYTAIGNVPQSLVAALQTLDAIGGIAGWLFAVSSHPRAKNGFMITGGKFNRTSVVRFQSSGRADYVVNIREEYFGPSELEIRTLTRVDGNLPDVPLSALLTLDAYTENYKRTAPGTLKSFAVRTYRVNDVAYKYTWENTITYDECNNGDVVPVSDVMRLVVSRHFVKPDVESSVVRYASSNKVGVFVGDDPCASAAETCNTHADCVPNADTFKCVCRHGFVGDGVMCEDFDECSTAPCDTYARCTNLPGSFECQCLPGYIGDGRVCRQAVRTCGNDVCDINARCVFAEGTRRPRCECSEGFRGDGVVCAPITAKCNEADICGDNAQCVFDEDLQEHVCECLDEFSGDGFSCEAMDNGCSDCDRYALCVRDLIRNVYTCQCDVGYTGDGRTCSVIDRCQNCHVNARCMFNDETSDYECFCLTGYRGDGTTCTLRDCREDPGMCDPEGGLCWLDEARNISFCRCNYGYRGNGLDCQPADCTDYNYCSEDAQCIDGTCQCNEGYTGDGRQCIQQSGGCDVYNNCDPNARCAAVASNPPRYECRCNTGYEGDGKVCRRMVPCNQVNNCDRNAECVYEGDVMSYVCRCARGYEGDGLSCRRREVMDCRRDPRMCSNYASCVEGSVDEYVCVCRSGYRGDGSTCTPIVREGNYLIYAQGSKVMRIQTQADTPDMGKRLVYMPGMLAVAVDTDCQEGDLYWTDAAKGVIRKSKLDGSGIETIITGLKSPEGIAVDYSARNLFFTDSEMDSLHVSRLDGTHMKTLVNTDMVNPRAIVLDIRAGIIYWTDWNRERPQIERMDMDGKQRQVLVSDGLRLPNGLAFDSYSKTLCWGDAGTRSIECILTNGGGRRVVYDEASWPFDIAMLNNVIYWSDWQRRDIANVNRSGGDMNNPLKLAMGGHGRTYGITAVKDQCPGDRNSCSMNNGNCQYLCLPSPTSGRSCACPDGMDPRICQQ